MSQSPSMMLPSGVRLYCTVLIALHTDTHTTVLRPFFRDHPCEPVPEENFWTSWCKGRLTEADTLIIRLGANPSRLTSAHLHHPPYFLQAGCPSCRPTNSVKALKTTSAFREKTLEFSPLPSNRHHRSSGDCLEGKGENYQVCSVQYCVQQLCTVRCTHI